MRKAMRQLDNHFKKVDVFLEVRDARLPLTSENPDLIEQLPYNMKRLVVYNKFDLVPQRKVNDLLKMHHESQNSKMPYITLSTKEGMNLGKLITFISKNAQP